MIGAQHEDRFRTAMDSRGLIGQAQGIVMQPRRMTGDQAFALLVSGSQHTKMKPRDLAARIVRDPEAHVEQNAGAAASTPRPVPR